MAFDSNSEFQVCFSSLGCIFLPLCLVNHCVWQVWALLQLITFSSLWHNPVVTTHAGFNILKESRFLQLWGCCFSVESVLIYVYCTFLLLSLRASRTCWSMSTVVIGYSFINKAQTNSSAPYTYLLQFLLDLEPGLLYTNPTVDNLWIFQLSYYWYCLTSPFVWYFLPQLCVVILMTNEAGLPYIIFIWIYYQPKVLLMKQNIVSS